jgi:hypothetical protein
VGDHVSGLLVQQQDQSTINRGVRCLQHKAGDESAALWGKTGGNLQDLTGTRL